MIMIIVMFMMMMMQLQTEAALLKSLTLTKVVVLGIGNVTQTELRDIASSPHHRNVILVPDFISLPTVEERLLDEICPGNHSRRAKLLNVCCIVRESCVSDRKISETD